MTRRLPLLLAILGLAACSEPDTPPVDRPSVQVLTVAPAGFNPSAEATGDIQARVQADLSFRISGKVVERRVDVGDAVKRGQLLARLDPAQQRAQLASAEAGVAAAQAQVKQTDADFWRQAQLLPKGYTSRAQYDQAQAAQRSARSSLDAAVAQRSTAREQLAYTELRADADGVITDRQAEVGQVVQATGTVFTLAHDGDRDAVFDLYQGLLGEHPVGRPAEVRLLGDDQVVARGQVREVSPTVSAQSGTVRVKVALEQVPPQMHLGSVVRTRLTGDAVSGVQLPWSALSRQGDRPAVWVVGAEDRVELRPVTLAGFQTGRFLVSQGLAQRDRVVTAGAQSLYPQQQVSVVAALARDPGPEQPAAVPAQRREEAQP